MRNATNKRNCKLGHGNKRAIFRRTISFALVMALFCCLNLSVLAAEPNVPTSRPMAILPDTGVMPTSVYGYAADYTDYDVDSFTVNAPGTSASKGGATLKTTDFPSYAVVYITIVRPDGTTAKSDIRLDGNTEVVVSFSNSIPGNYTIDYTVIGTYKGWIHAWIY